MFKGIGNSTLRYISVGLGCSLGEIVVNKPRKYNMKIQDIGQKGSISLFKDHYRILKIYQNHKLNYDYENTTYWKRFSEREKKWDNQRIQNRLQAFFTLYDKIKQDGFMLSSDPIIILDLSGVYKDFSLDRIEQRFGKEKRSGFELDDGKPIKYYRTNGAHRCAIAMALNVEKIPVMKLKIGVSKNG